MLSTEQVLRVREEIADNTKQFQKIYQDPNFIETYGEILGDKAKRIPKELREAAEIEPLIYNKKWYYFTKLKANTVLEDNLLEIVMAHFSIAKPMMAFL